jgi:hypothetical protein
MVLTLKQGVKRDAKNRVVVGRARAASSCAFSMISFLRNFAYAVFAKLNIIQLVIT